MDNNLRLYFILAIAAVAVVGTLIVAILKKRRAKNPEYQQMLDAFIQQVGAMLESGEKIVASCGYNPCVVATDKRLFISTKQGIDSVYYNKITDVKGYNFGKTTHHARGMQGVELMAINQQAVHKKYYIADHSVGYEEVAAMIDSAFDGD